MSDMQDAPMIVGLDIGSSQITVLVVRRDPDGGLRFVDAVHVPSRGISSGVVTSITDATAAITRALETAEERLPHRIGSACLGVGGRHLQSQNVRGAVTITPRGREITSEDVARAIAAAHSNLQRIENREILHEIPRAYKVDGHSGVQDPHGMAGYELEVEVHCATGAATILHNLLKCVEQAGIRRDHLLVVATPLAAGETVLEAHSDPQSLAVLDVGLETSKLALYINGSIWLSQVLPLGGQDFTQALSARLRLPLLAAEDLKLRYGSCDLEDAGDIDLVEMPPSASVEAFVPRGEIVRALHDHAEVFARQLLLYFDDLRRAGVEPAELVLVGGGADLVGLDTAMASVLDMPVRIGVPTGIRGLPPALEVPAYATASGLVHWYARNTPAEGRGRRKRRFFARPAFL